MLRHTVRRIADWIGLFGMSKGRGERLDRPGRRVDVRSLRMEPLEQRALLSVSGIGNEAFKAIPFSATGTVTSVYKASGYTFNLTGPANLSGGTATYTSVGDGTISQSTVSVPNGRYHATGKYTFDGSWRMTGYTDGVVDQVVGGLYGQLDGQAVVTSSSMSIPTQPTQNNLFNGTYDIDNAVFNTQNFSLVMQLTQGDDTKINFKGTLNPSAPQAFDVIVTPTWNADATAINVGVQVPGKPHTTTTSDRSVPVTNVQLYWANGTDFKKNKIGGPLADKIPVYWNEASGQYQVTDLPTAPAGATHLLFVTSFTTPTKATVTRVASLALPTVAITPPVGGYKLAEGDTAAPETRNVAKVPITLSQACTQDVTVSFTTFKGPKDTGKPGVDYVATTGSTVIPAGETQGTLDVPILGNTKYELNKTFSVKLTGVTNAVMSKTQSQTAATITNDDPVPSIAINDVSIAEGNNGNTQLTFTVTLSNPTYLPVQVKYSTAPGTAKAGIDYISKAFVTLPFAPGITTQTITVVIKGDTAVEENETFFVNLSAPKNATIGDAQGVGTIQNDDGQVAAKAAALRSAAVAQFAGPADLTSYFDPLGRNKDDKDASS